MKLFSLPNLFTLLNLCCGVLASILVISGGDIYTIFVLIAISLVADFLDGMVARALKVSSPIGKELDSLADVISFGITPGLMMLVLLLNFNNTPNVINTGTVELSLLSLLGLIVPAFSALRLAKFNLDEDQATYFKGLATPSNTLLLFSLFYIYQQNNGLINPKYDWIIIALITICCSFLLISNIPLFALKFKGLGWKENSYKYVFLLISLVGLITYQIYAIPFIMALYIIISLLYRKEIVK